MNIDSKHAGPGVTVGAGVGVGATVGVGVGDGTTHSGNAGSHSSGGISTTCAETEAIPAKLMAMTSIITENLFIYSVFTSFSIHDTRKSRPLGQLSLIMMAFFWHAASTMDPPKNLATAIFAGGCFWCVQSDLEKIPEVLSVISGYSGGSTLNPDYNNYASGGHREVVEVTYDSTKTSYKNLAQHLLRHIDPTDSTGSFADRGQAYAPALYYANQEERKIAEDLLADLEKSGRFTDPFAVAILPRREFWPAEDYHQNYAAKNPAHYQSYRRASGRDAFIKQHWQNKQ